MRQSFLVRPPMTYIIQLCVCFLNCITQILAVLLMRSVSNAAIDRAGRIAEQHPTLRMKSKLIPLRSNRLLDRPSDSSIQLSPLILTFTICASTLLFREACLTPRFTGEQLRLSLSAALIASPVQSLVGQPFRRELSTFALALLLFVAFNSTEL
jgi:hypothetical protein